MSKNPFRNEPSTNVKNDIEDWGKSKFKPKPFNRGNGREFVKNNSKPSFGNYNNKSRNKFNETARDVKPENPTPWKTFKNEIIYKQQEDDRTANQKDTESTEAKAALKQRKMNYRMSLVEHKKQEATKWEDFGEGDTDKQKLYGESLGLGDNKKRKNKTKNSIDNKSKYPFKKNKSTNGVLSNEEFISKDILKNFDGRKLNYQQKDKLRSVITKTTMLASTHNSLGKIVKDLKRRNMKN